MTKKETYGLLNIIKAAYPLFYSNTHKNAMDNVVEVWHTVLGQYDDAVAKRAIERMVLNETQIPTIAMVKSYICVELDKMAQARRDKSERELSGCDTEEAFQKKIAQLRR